MYKIEDRQNFFSLSLRCCLLAQRGPASLSEHEASHLYWQAKPQHAFAKHASQAVTGTKVVYGKRQPHPRPGTTLCLCVCTETAESRVRTCPTAVPPCEFRRLRHVLNSSTRALLVRFVHHAASCSVPVLSFCLVVFHYRIALTNTV